MLLPAITKAVKAKHGGTGSTTAACRARAPIARGARTRSSRSRATRSTYFGVRNSLGLLTETYSYASFKTRIKETYWFLEETLGFVREERREGAQGGGRGRTRSRSSGKQLAVRQELREGAGAPAIVFAPTSSERNPYVPDRPYRASARRRRDDRDAAVLRHRRADGDESRAARVGRAQRRRPRRRPRGTAPAAPQVDAAAEAAARRRSA